jgi:hypothetical protein
MRRNASKNPADGAKAAAEAPANSRGGGAFVAGAVSSSSSSSSSSSAAAPLELSAAAAVAGSPATAAAAAAAGGSGGAESHSAATDVTSAAPWRTKWTRTWRAKPLGGRRASTTADRSESKRAFSLYRAAFTLFFGARDAEGGERKTGVELATNHATPRNRLVKGRTNQRRSAKWAGFFF